MVQCAADCTGGCSVEIAAPKCKAELSPPSAECQGSAGCSTSCKALGSAGADCKEPAIEISSSESGKAAVIATLRAHLPALLLVAQARGELMIDGVVDVADLAGTLSGWSQAA